MFESFRFNSVLKKSPKNPFKSLLFNIKNKFQVSFITSTYNLESKIFWTGIRISFSGIHAVYFYNLVKMKLLNWKIFDLGFTNLSRFDLHYLRESKPTDKNHHHQLELFIENSYQKIHPKSKRRYAF